MYDYDQKPDLNITPLVDIMLVLLAILMVTAPVIEYEENIQLPQGSKTKQIENLEKIEIKILSTKEVLFGGNKFPLISFADNFQLASNSIDKQTPISIKADKNLLYDDVMNVLKVVKSAGFSKVALVTDG